MIQLTTYKVTDIEDWEDFVNKLFNGLKYYETRNHDFKFKITYTKDMVEVKTLKLGVHAN
jgi:hypothetical protein